MKNLIYKLPVEWSAEGKNLAAYSHFLLNHIANTQGSAWKGAVTWEQQWACNLTTYSGKTMDWLY